MVCMDNMDIQSERTLPIAATQSEAERKPFFKAARKIYLPDGWLAGRGLFWGCKGDEHDACARFIAEHHYPNILQEISQPADEQDQFSNVRKGLFQQGFAQLNHNTLILPKDPLTEAQVKLLNDAGIKIPVEINDPQLAMELRGMLDSLKDGQIPNEVREQLRLFLENGMRFSIDNKPMVADALYNLITKGFIPGGYGEEINTFKESVSFSYPRDKQFVVRLRQHQHDGSTPGLRWSSWITVMPYEEALTYSDFRPQDERNKGYSEDRHLPIEIGDEPLDEKELQLRAAMASAMTRALADANAHIPIGNEIKDLEIASPSMDKVPDSNFSNIDIAPPISKKDKKDEGQKVPQLSDLLEEE
jgi:hypothetical protein